MKKTFKNFMVENKQPLSIPNVIKKIKKDLKGNKYVDDILNTLHFSDKEDVEEALSRTVNNTIIAGGYVALSVIAYKVLKKFWSSTKKDIEELLDKDNPSEHAAALAKLSTKAVVVAGFLGFAVKELIKISKEINANDVDFGKATEEISGIDNKFK